MKFAHIRVSEYFTFAEQIFHSEAISLARRANFVEKSQVEFRLGFFLGRGGRTRTHDPWFWRPVLYQLSYTPTYRSIISYIRSKVKRFLLFFVFLNKKNYHLRKRVTVHSAYLNFFISNFKISDCKVLCSQGHNANSIRLWRVILPCNITFASAKVSRCRRRHITKNYQ